MPDGIIAQTAERSYGPDQYLAIPGQTFLAVKPTGLDEKTAQLLAGWYPDSARSDIDITDEDLAQQNLFIYGGPTINRLAERIAADLPIRFCGRSTAKTGQPEAAIRQAITMQAFTEPSASGESPRATKTPFCYSFQTVHQGSTSSPHQKPATTSASWASVIRCRSTQVKLVLCVSC